MSFIREDKFISFQLLSRKAFTTHKQPQTLVRIQLPLSQNLSLVNPNHRRRFTNPKSIKGNWWFHQLSWGAWFGIIKLRDQKGCPTTEGPFILSQRAWRILRPLLVSGPSHLTYNGGKELRIMGKIEIDSLIRSNTESVSEKNWEKAWIFISFNLTAPRPNTTI